jgi:ATP synthase protein I
MAMAMSAGYGALAVVLPAAVLVRGMGRQRGATQAGAVLMGFVVWESAKVALTVAMLVLAPRLVVSLSWLALVVGFVVTMKVYWVAAWLHSKRPNRNV